MPDTDRYDAHYFEAVKIEFSMYRLLEKTEELLAIARLGKLMVTFKRTQSLWPDFLNKDKEFADYKDLVKETEIAALDTYRILISLILPLNDILRKYSDSFETEDFSDLSALPMIILEISKNIGKQSRLPWNKSVSDMELVELGDYLLLSTIEKGFVCGDAIPADRREAFTRYFLGMESRSSPLFS